MTPEKDAELKASRVYGPAEWRCPQCKQTRWHKMDCTNQERNR